MVTATGGGPPSIATLRGSAKRRRKEGAVRGVLLAAAGISLVISVAIVLALLGQAISFLSHVELSSLWSGQWSPRQGQFDIPTLFIGSLVLESFFGIPGLGSYTIDAIQAQDFSVVRAMVFLGAVLYIVGLILTDISYTLADPRIRLQ